MILLDPRAGSKDYESLLRAIGAPVTLATLDFGDVAFWGSGRAIGIELKKLPDMLACITTGRFSGHQLPGLAKLYADAWLIVEGYWRASPDDGVLETRKGAFWVPVRTGSRTWMYRDLDNFFTTIDVKGGVRIKRTGTPLETARVIYGLYNWWQDYDGHRAHLAINRAGRDTALFVKPTLARRVAAELPGIGFDKSSDIAARFPTVRAMVDATQKDWLEVPGIGKKLAQTIRDAWGNAA